ncbi:MBL fold metallo-hydrolase [Streptomyces sp. cmx-4-9]|uniref:MBL fold metallo-hydrolase n=1 Tax=Streptomyces sp. cmx-4-9 TaxID=2790941 RepID=UPI0039805CC8
MYARGTGRLEIEVVGNATLLLRYGNVTLLTDPNFLHRGQYAYLGNGLVSRRLREPARAVEELPELDAIVLSHLHGDHFDRVARRSLDHHLPVFTTPHAARRLHTLYGFRAAQSLPIWQDAWVRKADTQVRITALPARHAGHPILRRLLPPVMGTLLQFGPLDGPAGVSLYLTGDTLLFEGLSEIPRRFPGIDLAVLHLGGTTLPGGLLVTMDAEQGVELARRLDPVRIMPVHYEQYTVMKSPLSAFLDAAQRAGLSDHIVHCAPGATTVFNGADSQRGQRPHLPGPDGTAE